MLKSICRDASVFDAPAVIEKLVKELNNSKNGVGLAANQIGIDLNVCIVQVKELITLVNPKIIEKYDLMEFHNEGCLSFPGEFVITKRYNEVVVKDFTHPAGIVCVGFEAVAVQHECSHLLGQTMHDYEIKIPARNDLCWCGSNKKYKVCHKNLKITQ